MTKYALNQDHNGIELYFSEKPNSSVINALKESGWRWHNGKKCWYNRQTAETLKQAEAITNEKTMKMEAARPEAKQPQANEFGVKIGDLFYASWGYEQTNIDFFQVIALKGSKSVLIREVYPNKKTEKAVSDMSRNISFEVTNELLKPLDRSVFVKDNERGDMKRISGTKDSYHISIDSFANAYPYSGQKLYESWYC